MLKAPESVMHLMQNWQFAIEIDGFMSALFTKGAPPEITNNKVEFDSAGSLYTMPAAGRVVFGTITLEKGILADGTDDAALQWLFHTMNVQLQNGWIPQDYMRTIDLVKAGRTGKPFRRWRLFSAFISQLTYSDLEGSSDDNTIETLSIDYHYAYPIDPDGYNANPIYDDRPEQNVVTRTLNTAAQILGAQ